MYRMYEYFLQLLLIQCTSVGIDVTRNTKTINSSKKQLVSPHQGVHLSSPLADFKLALVIESHLMAFS